MREHASILQRLTSKVVVCYAILLFTAFARSVQRPRFLILYCAKLSSSVSVLASKCCPFVSRSNRETTKADTMAMKPNKNKTNSSAPLRTRSTAKSGTIMPANRLKVLETPTPVPRIWRGVDLGAVGEEDGEGSHGGGTRDG